MKDTLSSVQPFYYYHTINQQNHIQKGEHPSDTQRASLGRTGEDPYGLFTEAGINSHEVYFYFLFYFFILWVCLSGLTFPPQNSFKLE